jgi:hypothetical protein
MEGEWSAIRDRTSWSRDRLTPALYQEEIAGKAGLAGARAALEHFRVPDVDRLAQRYAPSSTFAVSERASSVNQVSTRTSIRYGSRTVTAGDHGARARGAAARSRTGRERADQRPCLGSRHPQPTSHEVSGRRPSFAPAG